MTGVTQVQIRGADNATQQARTLASRELDIDTSNARLCVHDGSTAGGIEHATWVDYQNNVFGYAAASGTNAITATYSPSPTAYATGQRFTFKAANTISGAATFNVNGLGAKNIYKRDTSTGTLVAMATGEIIQNGMYTVEYDGTQFQILNYTNSSSLAGWDFIATGNAAGASSVDFTTGVGSSYANYMMVFRKLRAAVPLAWQLRRSSVWVSSGATYYWYTRERVGGVYTDANSSLSSYGLLTTGNIGAGISGAGMSGTILFTGIGVSGEQPAVEMEAKYAVESGGVTLNSFRTEAMHNGTGICDGLRLRTTSGSFTEGVVELYGLRNV